MNIEFLVEEPSAERALQHILPKILPPSSSYRIHAHQGKMDLLAKLPGKLRAYSVWLPKDWGVCVLVDEDRQNCHELKMRMAAAARQTGIRVLNRIAIEELEAWFFGDWEAVRSAYPKVSANVPSRSGYRDPDAIGGGTWEALERILVRSGHYRTRLPKFEAADRIARHMDPVRNCSKSFQVFRSGLRRFTKD